MAMPINITNLATTLTNNLNNVTSQINSVQNELATGQSIMNPASSGEVTRLTAQINAYNADIGSNTQAQNAVNVAITGLQSQTALIQQLQTLASQASTQTLSATDLSNLQTTFTQLANQIIVAANNANVNGINLLVGSATVAVLGGVDTSSLYTIQGSNMSAVATACTGLSIATAASAATCLSVLTTQLNTISAQQSNLSASLGGLNAESAQATALATGLQTTVNSLSQANPTQLQAQLQTLNNQQAIDYYLITQMNQEAAAMLAIFR
ncbi:hypothetical protein G6661_04015 [Polynucleobacter paneuropaeus]|nr:hypothetical protein G6661_04015 [Polynucleobacter paneuropaeus]